jgi:hypothetical protein
MLNPGLMTIIPMILIALLVISFWRQILALVLVVVVAIFCLGLYQLALLLGTI